MGDKKRSAAVAKWVCSSGGGGTAWPLAPSRAMNKLYYGNNLDVLRESVGTESVDLIYLDPPFNSKRDYNLLFKSPKAPAREWFLLLRIPSA